MGAGRNPAALGLLFTWTRGTTCNKMLLENINEKHYYFSEILRFSKIFLVIYGGIEDLTRVISILI